LKTKKIIALAIVAATLIAGGLYYRIQAGKKAEITYKEHVVKREDLEIAVQATGSVQPENRLVVKPQIPGRIDEVLIEEGKKVKAGQILAWMSSNDRAALVDMAKSASPAELKHWEEIYKPSPIIAPLGGIIISKQVERGQTVGTGDTVFVISDRLIVLAQVDETDLGKISLGQTVEIRVDAYGDRPVSGKVLRVAYESKLVNNVTIYEIRILPDLVPDFMRSGMTTSVKFVQYKKEGILAAPVSFLKFPTTPDNSPRTGSPPRERSTGQRREPEKGPEKPLAATPTTAEAPQTKSPNQCTVLLKSPNPGGTPEEKTITLGASNGKMAEVLSGLDEGAILLQIDHKDDGENKASNPFSPFGGGKKRTK
jgi:membrane fusion protein, macrolide-specific efflux system